MTVEKAQATDAFAERKHWMSVLAKADGTDLEKAWQSLPTKPDYDFLRAPETGLVMVRARAGGVGQPFNFGEMTVTRCTVRLANGTTGFGYVSGTDRRHAELAALFDALMHDTDLSDQIANEVIDPLDAAHAAEKRKKAAKSAATKVEFFTMVRGEND